MIEYSIPRKYRAEIDLERLNLCFSVSQKQLDRKDEDSLSLKFTDNATIKKLNKKYRGVNEPTDVLSFENNYIDLETGFHNIGDIVISFEKAQAQAVDQCHPVQQEVEMLFIHGILHLYGYDHADEEGFAAMSKLQDEILKAVGNSLLGCISPL